MGGGLDSLTSPMLCGFSKNLFSRERLKSFFFVTFKIIESHIFPANFNVISQVIQKIWRFSLSIYPIFIDFSNFLHFLVAKKLITSVYNRWYQHFFTFDLLEIGCLTIVQSYIDIRLCLTIVQSYIDIRLVLLEIRSELNWNPPLRKNQLQKVQPY